VTALSDEVYDFGTRLKKFRKAAKLKQIDVANRLDVTVGMVRKYESNTALPPVDKLEAMAIMYRTSLDHLRNLDKRDCIFIDDLPPAQRKLVKSIMETLKYELKTLGVNKTGG